MSNVMTSAVALLVIFVFAVSANPDLVETGKYFLAQAGSYIGVTASVPPNPVNTAAKQLADKERELALREQGLNERERELNRYSSLSAYAIGGSVLLLAYTYILFHMKDRREGSA